MVIDAIDLNPHKGHPIRAVNIMQHEYIERIADSAPGSYKKNPHNVYMQCQRNMGVCVLDQYLAENPLTMGNKGYEIKELAATTGLKEIYVDGMLIDSPEAVIEHMEKYAFPEYSKRISSFDEEVRIREILNQEYERQQSIGISILKTGYGFYQFPKLSYGVYGYENYFMAYALYPEIIERYFSLQADYWTLNNNAACKAIKRENLPKIVRLDHDMTDSRGTLVSIESLEKMWFPHLERCLRDSVKAGIKFIWHCDGNITGMIPGLIDVGLKGFQGFQYEDGVDYIKLCKMKTKDKEPMIIWAGVSVTTTLPMGRPYDVKRELEFLVENGPGPGLFLGVSSSVTPGMPWENIKTLAEGLRYYRNTE